MKSERNGPFVSRVRDSVQRRREEKERRLRGRDSGPEELKVGSRARRRNGDRTRWSD